MGPYKGEHDGYMYDVNGLRFNPNDPATKKKWDKGWRDYLDSEDAVYRRAVSAYTDRNRTPQEMAELARTYKRAVDHYAGVEARRDYAAQKDARSNMSREYEKRKSAASAALPDVELPSRRGRKYRNGGLARKTLKNK